MRRIERPLDEDAVESADEQIYAAHADDDRPNALYDARGNRRRLSANDPSQEALRQEWREYYFAAVDANDAPPEGEPASGGAPSGSGSGSTSTGPPPPASNADPGDAAPADCEETHWFIVTVKLRVPDGAPARPPFWPPAPNEAAFLYEFYKAKTPAGPDESYLDANAATKYTLIPAGSCQIGFPEAFTEMKEFFDDVIRG